MGYKSPLLKRKITLPDENEVGKLLTIQKEKSVEVEKEGKTKKQIVAEQIQVEYSHVEALYRQFKKNLEEERDWEDAGEFHYGEMECKRRGLTGKTEWRTFLRQNFGLLAWYRYFSGYGERPLRALCWFVFYILFFAGLYYLLDARPKQQFLDHYLWNLSIKASFLQRIGDSGSEPAGFLGKLLYLVQSALCPTLIALFVLALRRRLRR